MSNPTVSVVMPVYNVERFVGTAIQSVLDQSYRDFELIVVDDGGCDGSLEICRSFDDPRIRIVSQANRGLAGARNTGIMAARGAYIALLDSDDLWEHDKLAWHVAHLNADPGIGASTSAARLINMAGEDLHITQRPKMGRVAAVDVFCGRVILNGSTPVFRREMLERGALLADPAGRRWYFDETLRRSEDVECWTRLALKTSYRFEAIDRPLTKYRVNGAGLSADVIRQLATWDEARDRIALLSPGFVQAYGDEARGRELRYLARRCVQTRDRGLGFRLAIEAISHYPALLLQEPLKTLTTLLACAALRLLPPGGFLRLLQFTNPALAAEATP